MREILGAWFTFQVQLTLQNFFLNTKVDLYLLQVDTKKVHMI